MKRRDFLKLASAAAMVSIASPAWAQNDETYSLDAQKNGSTTSVDEVSPQTPPQPARPPLDLASEKDPSLIIGISDGRSCTSYTNN